MLRIALAQINTTVGDLEGNLVKMAQFIRRSREVGADVVVFPELATTGYPPEDLLFKKHFVEDNLRMLKKLMPETANITAIVGCVDVNAQGKLFNAAAVIHNHRLQGMYHKKELPNYGVFDEKRYFTAGSENKIFLLNQNTLGISICEDIWTPAGPCREQITAGAKILINISSSPYHFAKDKLREDVLCGWAKEYKVYVAYTNLVGGQDELVFDGRSMIVDPRGQVIAAGKQFAEDLVIADIDIPKKSKIKKIKNVQSIAIPKAAHEDARLKIAGQVARRLDPAEEIYQALVLGTRDYLQKNGFKKAVIGLSGGIDSSLVAVIACAAIGRENVVGVSMPSQFTSVGTRSDARILAKNLGIQLMEVPIAGILSTYLFVLRNEFAGQQVDTTEENLQARIRGNILMALSNKFGWLVLTTGNKSEIAVGYCTLYGDMSGGFAVIKDVPKTKVYEIARFINKTQNHVIPDTVLKRAPTAELRENQKDQDTLPPYDVLDDILKYYVEDRQSAEKIIKRQLNAQLVEKVIKMVDRSEYKRRQAAPGIKITPRAFGKDWRLPITNKYKEV
ncbi:MAG: NAD+ synthase [Omnitrophica WOR_2 bacterium RIFCSPHIGHO2_01_FULL_48_9]|nr:MAG: NAD+ synthase [Omnitrophica WOR_2 bacterium RIFCSPHIGHO2_01_FULL_48_9]